MFRTLTRGQLTFDIVVPSVLLALLFVPYFQSFTNLLVLIGMCLSLVLWRLNAGLALAVAWITAIAQMLIGLTPDPSNLAIFIVLYATTAYGNRLVKWLGFASCFVGAAAIALYVVILPTLAGAFGWSLPDLIQGSSIALFSFLALFLLAWTLGLLAKTYSSARESRRAQSAAELERQRARRDVMVEQERTRIARDMHDVVAHSLAVVIAQADGARYARASDPQAVDDALSAISSTARDALGDVRALLAQLRHSQIEGPQPVLADLDRLLDQMRASGLTIRSHQHGLDDSLGSTQQLAIYRIVQEALTNSLRHADISLPVTVTVERGTDAVEASVSSALVSPVDLSTREGHGLSGMRERASLTGGRLEIDQSGGRFTVTAVIPKAGGQLGALPAAPLETVP